MYVHHPEDNSIDLVYDENLWVSWDKGVDVHVKVWWGGLVTVLLVKGEECHGRWVHLQTVVMELVFRAESFSFSDRMVYVREISEGVFGFHLQTWVQCIGERGGFGG